MQLLHPAVLLPERLQLGLELRDRVVFFVSVSLQALRESQWSGRLEDHRFGLYFDDSCFRSVQFYYPGGINLQLFIIFLLLPLLQYF